MNLDDLQGCLGYQFSDLGLLQEALTHASVDSDHQGSYQRFEFLGDRVLGLIVSDTLYRAFPHADEGELALRFNELVKFETCAKVARALHLGDHIMMSLGEERSGGRDRDSILADVMESVIGAIYYDGGFEVACRLVRRYWVMDEPGLTLQRPRQDAKTELQEWVQKKGLRLPVYDVIVRSGPDHAPTFKIQVQVESIGAAHGVGKSRRSAEQLAARNLLSSIMNNQVDLAHVEE